MNSDGWMIGDIAGDFHANREGNLVGNLLRLVCRIDTCSYDRHTNLFKFRLMLFKAD
jgi:hypothetical protein